MKASTQIEDLRVDLDGVDMTGSLGESHGNIVAGAGPDDENTRRRAPPSRW